MINDEKEYKNEKIYIANHNTHMPIELKNWPLSLENGKVRY